MLFRDVKKISWWALHPRLGRSFIRVRRGNECFTYHLQSDYSRYKKKGIPNSRGHSFVRSSYMVLFFAPGLIQA